MVYIIRNGSRFGPYDEQTLLSYVDKGHILLCDRAVYVDSSQVTTVRKVLKSAGKKVRLESKGDLLVQLRRIGCELIFPKQIMVSCQWINDKKLLLLALVGLCPLALSFMPIRNIGLLVFYLISLYFAMVWGLFFYYFFKTPQVSVKTTVSVFFITQIFVFAIWDLSGIILFNPFYHMIKWGLPFSLVGFILGVGLTEEMGKAIPLLIIARRAKEPLIPQTLVYYGLVAGIAFGVFEGVQYQMTVNQELDYTSAFFMNIARLTSFPFLHAVWSGIAGYFIAFAKLYVKYRHSLYFLAIVIPTLLHGVYDTFCDSLLGMVIALPITFIGVILLMTYLKQGINYQSKFRE